MISISLCMIVKNEEDVLERCLNSVSNLIDEIIIVDTGSTDKTKIIASKFTEKIYDFKWNDDFSSARNYSFSKATKDYIFWMDADDILLDEDKVKFLDLKTTLNNNIDVVSMLYKVGYENNNTCISFRRYRLLKRSLGIKWSGHVHEFLVVKGNVINSQISIIHKKLKPYTTRNLKIYERMKKEKIKFTPRDTFYYTTELFENGYTELAIPKYKDFIEKEDGMIEEKINGCSRIADYYYLKGEYEKSKKYCLQSFLYEKPRAEFCCRLGFCFFEMEKYLEAIFWYDLATKLNKPESSLGFFNDSCWTWLPYLQLCKCYDILSNEDLAYECNEKALQYNKNNKLILNNKKYFQKLGYS